MFFVGFKGYALISAFLRAGKKVIRPMVLLGGCWGGGQGPPHSLKAFLISDSGLFLVYGLGRPPRAKKTKSTASVLFLRQIWVVVRRNSPDLQFWQHSVLFLIKTPPRAPQKSRPWGVAMRAASGRRQQANKLPRRVWQCARREADVSKPSPREI